MKGVRCRKKSAARMSVGIKKRMSVFCGLLYFFQKKNAVIHASDTINTARLLKRCCLEKSKIQEPCLRWGIAALSWNIPAIKGKSQNPARKAARKMVAIVFPASFHEVLVRRNPSQRNPAKTAVL